ncbi:ZDHHC14, partial [Symbiodinium pilosum]
LDKSMSMLFYVMCAVGVLVSLAAFLSLVLWLYHLYLIVTRQTTKEFRKGIANIDEEPTLCAARGPQLFDPWALVDPKELRNAKSKRKRLFN